MTGPRRIESVGWGFFGLVLVAAVPACIYLVFQITHDGVTVGTRAGSGVALAFFAAAFISWAVNSVLQFRVHRLEEKEKKGRNSR